MKKRSSILGIAALIVLGVVAGFVFRNGGAKAEITMNGKTYQMCSMSVREFMEDGYVFAAIDYTNASLEAKTYYNTGVPLKVKGNYGAPINIWIYNPTAEQVEIREGKISAISCDVQSLLADGVSVSIAGLKLKGQSKDEIAAYMSDALKGYTYSENEDVNAISYTKGSVSYTFRFDEDDILEAGIARNSV